MDTFFFIIIIWFIRDEQQLSVPLLTGHNVRNGDAWVTFVEITKAVKVACVNIWLAFKNARQKKKIKKKATAHIGRMSGERSREKTLIIETTNPVRVHSLAESTRAFTVTNTISEPDTPKPKHSTRTPKKKKKRTRNKKTR